MINLTRALHYPFGGPNPLAKTLIGALWWLFMPLFAPIFFMLGYQVRIVRDVIDGRDDELPEWNDLGEDFLAGVVVFAGTLLYYLPSVILTGLGARLLLNSVRLDVDALLLGSGLSFELDRPRLAMMLVCFALALLWLVLSAPLVMASVARYAETGEFSAFVNILERADEAWEQRGAAGSLMLNLFLLLLISQVAQVIGSTVCVLTPYVQFITFAATCHLNGQWGLLLKQKRRKPSVIRPIGPVPR